MFVVIFLPLFVSLGVWQLNRATEKEQMLNVRQQPVELTEVNALQPPLYRTSQISAPLSSEPLFLLDNRTHDGQFGYEVFALAQTPSGHVAVSLGWVAGSADRTKLPSVSVPVALAGQTVTWRRAPANALLGVDANSRHSQSKDTWIVQALTRDWIESITGQSVLGFAQLNDAEATGVGPVIWQATVMSPTKHRAYAVQWFCMAAALLAMFVYAGFKPVSGLKTDTENNKNN